MSLRRLRSVAASAWTHRGIAMLAVVIGGGQVGAALRRLADPSPDFGLVAQTYLAGWLWRAGVPLTALYDPTTLRAAQAQLQPDGPVLAAPWLQPPSLALLGIPLTPFTLPGAYSVFSLAAVAAVVVGLIGLGWRRPGGWNRSDWLLLAGITLGSSGTLIALRHGEPTPIAFAAAGWLLAAAENRRNRLALGLAFLLGTISATVWILVLLLGITRRWRSMLWMGGTAAGASLLCLSLFGPAAYAGYLGALWSPDALPAAADPSLHGQLRWIFSLRGVESALPVHAVSALVLVLGLLAFRRQPNPEVPEWRGLPVGIGLLLGTLVLPGALPSRTLLALPALWIAGRLAVRGQATAAQWGTLILAGALLVVPWPTRWLASSGLGAGWVPVVGEIVLLLWLARALADPGLAERIADGEIADPDGRRSVEPGPSGS